MNVFSLLLLAISSATNTTGVTLILVNLLNDLQQERPVIGIS